MTPWRPNLLADARVGGVITDDTHALLSLLGSPANALTL